SFYSATPSHASQRERAFTLNAEQFHFEFWILSASASSMAQMLARFAGEGSLTFVRSTEEFPISVAFPILSQPLAKSKLIDSSYLMVLYTPVCVTLPVRYVHNQL